MSNQSPRVLLDMSIKSLLKDKALSMEAIGHLPGELFPSVFMEAFIRGHTEVLKAMVQSWPFTSLPLGALMNMKKAGSLDTQKDVLQAEKMVLQAVLDGIDMLLRKEVCSRMLKLQVLDMRVTRQDFWRVWAERKLENCSSESMNWGIAQKIGPREPSKRPLKVILDLWITEECLRPWTSTILQWIRERKDLVQLHCLQLCITAMSFQWVTEVLEVLELDSVREVDVSPWWPICTLAQFAPFLSQMENLHKLILCDICVPASMPPEEREQLVTEVTFPFLKLHSLREVFMDTVEFLEGHMDQFLRCLTSPLETLSVTNCQLSLSDWNHLPFSEKIRQLKHLDLSCTKLTSFSPESLQLLLSSVAATLTTLHLENCGITDAQVSAFLPALSSCSQLTTFCFIKNSMSIYALKNLLCHTTRLSNLTLELYSVPQE
ncbi:PRAME family member 12-like, partial [Octodon degus]|uniref:Leucine-rich repeat-containing protein 14 n=1 Tax=Octodon degus TaxID=10160 RepID=A0A6P3FZ45_OCTDE